MLSFDANDLPTLLADQEMQALVEDRVVEMVEEGYYITVKGDQAAQMFTLNKLSELGIDYTYSASSHVG